MSDSTPTYAPPTAAPTETPGSPIADLSYRNYDGPLHNRAARWWIVALANIRQVRKKPGFWILFGLAFLPCLMTGVGFFFRPPMPVGMMDPAQAEAMKIRFGESFFAAADGQAFLVFLIALLVGAGSIASDNRANALIVYLSKPITKGDYLLGKWAGIFMILFGVAFVPSLVLYIYCLITYIGDGFLKDQPWLLPRIFAAALVPAIMHASVLMGFSAWSKTSRMAGAVYAGFFFVSAIVVGIIWGIFYRNKMAEGVLLQHLSLGGVIRGLMWNIYNVPQTVPQYVPEEMSIRQITLHAPDFWPLLALAGVFVVLGLGAARMKIQAVEVVRG